MSDDSGLPSKLLLERHHRFPCVFTFKIVMNHMPDAEQEIVRLVTLHVSDPTRLRTSLSRSSSGRFESVSLQIYAANADEVLAVYKALGATPGLRMLM
jgi:putative lipoic acid-binding regulatory protein